MTGSADSANGSSERREPRSWRIGNLQFSLLELGLFMAATAVAVGWYIDHTRLSDEIERPRNEDKVLQQEANRLRHEIQKLGVNYLGGN